MKEYKNNMIKKGTAFMKRTLNNIYVSLAAMCALCLLAASCLSDDYDNESGTQTGTASVRLYISAVGMGDLNATRAGDTEVEDGELINSLYIIAVQDGSIVWKGDYPASKLGGGADKGNLEAYTIENITDIPAGTTTFYAFANYDYDTSSVIYTLVSGYKGGTFSEDALKTYVNDPAKAVNNGSYIPMTGMKEATLKGDLNNTRTNVEIELYRLVGKVRIKVLPETTSADKLYESVDITKLELTYNVPTKVALFSGNAPSETMTYADKKITIAIDDTDDPAVTWESTSGIAVHDESSTGKYTITNQESPTDTQITKFYVNEGTISKYGGSGATSTEGFYVDMSTERKDEGGVSYDATAYSKSQQINRNAVFPLVLTLDKVDASFGKSKALTAGIGTTENAYLGWEKVADDIYKITLYDVTSSLELAPELTCTNANEINNAKYTLTLGTGSELVIRRITSGSYTYDGTTLSIGYGTGDYANDTYFYITHFTAIDYEYDKDNPATLVAEWDNASTSGLHHTRTFKIYICLEEGKPEFSNLPIAPWTLTKKNIAPLRPLTRRLD